ncbi:MAG: hypothetical protein JHC95_10325 [Solirubrobacteraceae bacterium]|nr:hypothetical protein [Solirubrobacteraceae bacterium]
MRRAVILLLAVGACTSVGDARAELPDVGTWIGNREAAASSAGHLAVPSETSDFRLVIRFADPGGTFGPPVPLPGKGGYAPVVALGPSGEALVVWTPGGPNDIALAAFRPPGGAFGPAEQIATDAAFGEDGPSIAFDAAGTAAVLWASTKGKSVVVRQRASDGTWSPRDEIRAPNAFRPQLALASSGAAVATWRQTPRIATRGFPKTQVAVATRPAGSRFGAPQVIAGLKRDTPQEPVLNMNDRGDAVVAWIEDEPERGEFFSAIYAAFRSGEGRFGRPTRISRRLVSGSGPSVSVGADGRMVLAWGAYWDRTGEARIRTASGRLLPIRVVSRDLQEDTAPVALAYGQGVVAWNDRDPGVTHVRFAHANGVGAFGPPEHVLTAREIGGSRAPQLFAVPSGLVLVGPGDRISRSP